MMITYRNVIAQLNIPAEQVIEQNDLLDKVYGILSKGSSELFPFIVFYYRHQETTNTQSNAE